MDEKTKRFIASFVVIIIIVLIVVLYGWLSGFWESVPVPT
jgi:hypothetical protein